MRNETLRKGERQRHPTIARALGRLLKGRHAGEEKLIWNHSTIAHAPASIRLSSSAFAHDGPIPLRYAGAGVGENISPPLRWSNIPESAVELALVMEDPDAPLPKPFVHLIAAGVSSALTGLEEGALSAALAGLLLGSGTFGKVGYSGPRALPAHGPHRYVFQIFAVNGKLSFPRTLTRKTLLEACHGKVIGRGCLVGFFERE
jgi:Raf kinase inhibitor-like YbhB/YbcL family protein